MEELQSVPLMNKLRGLSREELENILNSTEQQEGLVLDSEEVQNLQLEREMLLAANRSLAEKNLEFQPQLEEGKGQLQDKYTELQNLHDTVQEHRTELERFHDVAGPDSLLSVLQAEGAKIEEETEELAEKFLEGQFALEVFLEQYNERRKLAHLRRVRIEKLQEILSRPQQPAATVTPDLPEPPHPQPSQRLPQRPPPPRPSAIQPSPAAHPAALPYNPNPGVAGVPHQVMSPYPAIAGAAPPHFYPQPSPPLCPYPVQAQFPAGQPPYPTYPMPMYNCGPSGPPPLPPRPGYRQQPQPGYHMPQPY
uniref:vacuolar protein sorting-associated protein 37C-like isoform X2 n=2 Tax=Pristiophorus japonicus TaxID=55135 RepID=UPI00398E3B6A